MNANKNQESQALWNARAIIADRKKRHNVTVLSVFYSGEIVGGGFAIFCLFHPVTHRGKQESPDYYERVAFADTLAEANAAIEKLKQDEGLQEEVK